ncbi:MAG: PqqD family protein [Acidobacteriota bacterium]
MTERPDATDDSRLARAEGLVASEVNGEIVILSIDSGHFFHLNSTGSRLWTLLETPLTVAELCEAARARFAVDAEDCRRDVTEFVQGLVAKGLLQGA